eukprot:gene8258-biopygen79
MPSVARRRRRCPPPWRRSATRPGATARRGAAQRSEARARRSAAQCRAAQCRAAPCGAARRAVAWRSAAPRGAAPAAPDLFFRGHLWRPFSARNTVESNVGRMERRLQFVLHFDFVWSRVFCSFLRFGLARFCRVRCWLLSSAFGAVPRLNAQAAAASSFAPPAKLTQVTCPAVVLAGNPGQALVKIEVWPGNLGQALVKSRDPLDFRGAKGAAEKNLVLAPQSPGSTGCSQCVRKYQMSTTIPELDRMLQQHNWDRLHVVRSRCPTK